jgi:hypothetical protein
MPLAGQSACQRSRRAEATIPRPRQVPWRGFEIAATDPANLVSERPRRTTNLGFDVDQSESRRPDERTGKRWLLYQQFRRIPTEQGDECEQSASLNSCFFLVFERSRTSANDGMVPRRDWRHQARNPAISIRSEPLIFTLCTTLMYHYQYPVSFHPGLLALFPD